METKRKTEPTLSAEDVRKITEAMYPTPEPVPAFRYYGFAIVKIPIEGVGIDAEAAEKNALEALRAMLPPRAVVTESVLGAPPSPTGP